MELQQRYYVNVNALLSLSLDKTCYSIYGSTDTEKSKIHLKINDVEIKQVDSSKYLGILIDSKLTWQNRTDYVYNKIIKFTSHLYSPSVLWVGGRKGNRSVKN